jgi:hypothetical protein
VLPRQPGSEVSFGKTLEHRRLNLDDTGDRDEICFAVCPVRFMVKFTAQSGRMKTLIHPGPIAGVHVKTKKLLRILMQSKWRNQQSCGSPLKHILRVCVTF